MTTDPIREQPTKRTQLTSVCIAARHGVDRRLRILGRNWTWLADRMHARGIASEALIQQWKRGRVQQIGCGVYLAILDELAAAEKGGIK
jgi:hypothetical protein